MFSIQGIPVKMVSSVKEFSLYMFIVTLYSLFTYRGCPVKRGFTVYVHCNSLFIVYL